MPPKSTKKQSEKISETPIIETPIIEKPVIEKPVPNSTVNNFSEFDTLLEQWIQVNKELTGIEAKKAPLEKKRDDLISQIARLKSKPSSTVVLETINTPTETVSKTKVVKGKAKTPVVEVEPEEIQESVKPTTKKTTKKTSVVKEVAPVVKEVVPAPKSASKKSAVVSKQTLLKNKQLLEEDSDDIVPKNINVDASSSDTDIESLSCCSSESECSGGEDD